MAIKKNEMYTSLYASCDALRGGMEPSEYKNYILPLLFVKYATDRYKGDPYGAILIPEGGSFDDMVALRGNNNIGEGLDKVIAKLAEANRLQGVIDNAHFNDDRKLGSGQAMVDKLSGLIAIFQRPEFDFRSNRASGDDILGDAYEYLMRRFAIDSGKSKGQFYTPAEVSRILARVVGIGDIRPGNHTQYTICDPACGSGSLLLRAISEARTQNFQIYGQELESTTAGLAKMNLYLHNHGEGVITGGKSTFSDPAYFESGYQDQILRRFDFIVMNPPFSLRNWKDGYQDFGRLEGFPAPPEKNADYAWFLHVLKSLKSTGKAAIIMPLGVLFRGNAEGAIRREILNRGLIKAVITLPANIFYGTGIPGCIVVVDKADAAHRRDVFMIDASRYFVKDGNKNRLREEDIFRILDTYEKRLEVPHYSRAVPLAEIAEKNDYNLNISRYIEPVSDEIVHDIPAHLQGGIPETDIEALAEYWKAFPGLRESLFAPLRPGYVALRVKPDDVRETLLQNPVYADAPNRLHRLFSAWTEDATPALSAIHEETDRISLISSLSTQLMAHVGTEPLLDPYDVYEVLLSYWNEVMSDDVYLVQHEGFGIARETETLFSVGKSGRNKGKKVPSGWQGVLLSRDLIEGLYFMMEETSCTSLELRMDELDASLASWIEEQSEEGGVLFGADAEDDADSEEADDDKGDKKPAKLNPKTLKKLAKEARSNGHPEDASEFERALDWTNERARLAKELKTQTKALDEAVRKHYATLSDEECRGLLLQHKWFAHLESEICALYETATHSFIARITDLAKRYEVTLGSIASDVSAYEAKVAHHLHAMGLE